MMRHLYAASLGLLALLFLSGCRPSGEASGTAASPDAAVIDEAAMLLVVMTDEYDTEGEHLDQQMKTEPATADLVAARFNGLDWQHPLDRHSVGVGGGRINTPDWKKLTIREELPDGGTQTVLTAILAETRPGESTDQRYTYGPLESPEVGLKLLLSFLAQDGDYRTMVDWREQ